MHCPRQACGRQHRQAVFEGRAQVRPLAPDRWRGQRRGRALRAAGGRGFVNGKLITLPDQASVIDKNMIQDNQALSKDQRMCAVFAVAEGLHGHEQPDIRRYQCADIYTPKPSSRPAQAKASRVGQDHTDQCLLGASSKNGQLATPPSSSDCGVTMAQNTNTEEFCCHFHFTNLPKTTFSRFVLSNGLRHKPLNSRLYCPRMKRLESKSLGRTFVHWPMPKEVT